MNEMENGLSCIENNCFIVMNYAIVNCKYIRIHRGNDTKLSIGVIHVF